MPAARRDPLLALAAFASLGAGVVHAAIAPEHRDWWASAAFFVALAAFQVGWAAFVLLRSAPRPVLLLGAAVNLAALGTWLVSRTTGMPFGPHRGEAEPLARADAIASLLGALVVLGAIGAARGWDPLARTAGARAGLTTSAGGVAVSALSILALTGVSGHAHAPGGDHGAHGDALATVAAATTTDRGTSAEIRALTACSTEALALADREVRARAAAERASGAKSATAARSAKTKAAKATKAVKQQKRVLAECRRAAAVTPSDPAPTAPREDVKTEPHDDSGGHGH